MQRLKPNPYRPFPRSQTGFYVAQIGFQLTMQTWRALILVPPLPWATRSLVCCAGDLAQGLVCASQILLSIEPQPQPHYTIKQPQTIQIFCTILTTNDIKILNCVVLRISFHVEKKSAKWKKILWRHKNLNHSVKSGSDNSVGKKKKCLIILLNDEILSITFFVLKVTKNEKKCTYFSQ